MAIGSGLTTFLSQRATINDLELDASVTETHEWSGTFTKSPVEGDSSQPVTEHFIPNPFKLTIEGVVSETPLNIFALGAVGITAAAGLARRKAHNKLVASAITIGAGSLGGLIGPASSALGITQPRSKKDVYEHLVKMMKAAVPFTVITALQKYDDMVITSVSVPRSSASGDALHFTIAMEQVRLVRPLDVTVSVALPSAAKAEDLGKQQAQQASKKVQDEGSLLFRGAKALNKALGGGG